MGNGALGSVARAGHCTESFEGRHSQAPPLQLRTIELDSSKEYFGLNWIGSHGFVTGLPAGGTNFIRVRLDVLNSLQSAEGFVHVAAESKIVDSRVLDDAFFVDDKQTSEGNACFWIEDVVVGTNCFFEVSNQGIVEVADTAGFAVCLYPS
jgi:hypothetical protein